MHETVKALIVEDSEDDCLLVARQLQRAGIPLDWTRVQTRPQFLDALLHQEWHLVLSDHSMPHFSSLEALQLVREHDLDIPFVIVSGTIGEEQAVAAMRAGASDYVLKGNLARLPEVVVREHRERENRRAGREAAAALRHLEDQLHQAQKMEAMGRLAGGIAHDFNNLLTAILGFSGMALESLTPTDPIRLNLDQVVLAAERASRLTSRLLAFCRREPSRPSAVDVNETLRTLTPMLQRLIGADVKVVAELDLGRPTVMVDPAQLEQTLMNLAVNARDAMPDGGTLTFVTHALSLEVPRASALGVVAGWYVAITVRDTGHGMDESTRARVFEPFFTTKEAGKGTGLGLSTVYGLVTQSGGAVTLDTAPGAGTTFTIFLPRHEGSAATADAGAEQAAVHATSETVLVVENDAFVRRLAITVLESAGYRVLAASSSDDAAQLAAATRVVHLLLTNLIMPGGTGRDLARLVRAQHPTLRTLYMSGYANHDAMPDLAADPGVLLSKPFGPAALLSAIRARLDAPLTGAS